MHQVGKQDYIVLRCTVNNTLKSSETFKQCSGIIRHIKTLLTDKVPQYKYTKYNPAIFINIDAML